MKLMNSCFKVILSGNEEICKYCKTGNIFLNQLWCFACSKLIFDTVMVWNRIIAQLVIEDVCENCFMSLQ